MPSLDMYKRINKNKGSTLGQRRKYESDLIMEETWDGDIQSCTGYFYDYYHDDEKTTLWGLSPEDSLTKIPIEIKYITVSYNSEAKDIMGKHIQFKPSVIYNHPVYYYENALGVPYQAEFPIGLYLDIWDDNTKKYRKWLVCEPGYNLDNQFPTWYILPCDHVFQWIYKGKKYQMCGVARSQNSYNSGVWDDFKITSPENQRKCILPMNELSSTIYYNQRIIISAPIPEPITWQCSKVENTQPKGIQRLTFTQERFDQFKDYIEKDDQGNVIGMWADYYQEPIKEIEIPQDEEKIYSLISYSGTKSQLKIGGSYKTYTVKFYKGESEVDVIKGKWSFTINGEDASSLVTYQILSDSQIKVKFSANDDYLYEKLIIQHTTDDGTINSDLEVELIGL